MICCVKEVRFWQLKCLYFRNKGIRFWTKNQTDIFEQFKIEEVKGEKKSHPPRKELWIRLDREGHVLRLDDAVHRHADDERLEPPLPGRRAGPRVELGDRGHRDRVDLPSFSLEPRTRPRNKVFSESTDIEICLYKKTYENNNQRRRTTYYSISKNELEIWNRNQLSD